MTGSLLLWLMSPRSRLYQSVATACGAAGRRDAASYRESTSLLPGESTEIDSSIVISSRHCIQSRIDRGAGPYLVMRYVSWRLDPSNRAQRHEGSGCKIGPRPFVLGIATMACPRMRESYAPPRACVEATLDRHWRRQGISLTIVLRKRLRLQNAPRGPFVE